MNDAAPKARQGYHKLRALEVVGGFLDGACFEFSDALNCLIGCRGTGKTTVLEFVRYALAALPAGEDNRPLCRNIESLVRSNLGGGRLKLTIETKDGLCYVVHRTFNEDPQVFTPEGKATGIALGHGGLFSADVYSQNQIENIANNPRFQLTLIDTFIETEVQEVEAGLRAVHRDLQTNAAGILRLEREIAELDEGLGELPVVEEQLKAFAQGEGENVDEINRQHALKALRDREKRGVVGLGTAVRDFRNDLAGRAGQLQRLIPAHLEAELLAGPNKAIVTEVRDAVRQCAEEVDASIRTAVGRLDAALENLLALAQKLKAAHQEQDQVFRSVIETHEHAQAQAAERTRLEQRRNELMAQQRSRDEKRGELRRHLEARADMLKRASEFRDRRFQRRYQVAEHLSARLAPTIRVRVEQFGNADEYMAKLQEGLRNSGVQPGRAALKIANGFAPPDFARAVRQNDVDALTDLAELNQEQARKVISAFGATQRIFEIESVELFDLPHIELLDGDEYKDSTTLSTGQKCTTILPILLLESESPLLIDQPEDNLDNRFIYETVVRSVQDVKTKRQLVFVTHNPNIPVLGEAERVFVLSSSGKKATLDRVGSVDECKGDIETLLEGGREAFELRMQKYGH
ncbi:MAG TPA: AAA family ATPase [Planctomycetota bacterium]|nr:AAA family ATPase [Planctomycetota bacterium]HRR82267.1 AAA family ATPase [Planctomycetota bacterium]HRT94223.1 AAA family ATPase [Planctomycetota bacterium]